MGGRVGERAGAATPRVDFNLDDCFLHDKDRLTHAEALALIEAQCRPIAGTGRIPLAVAGGRYAAEAVVSPRNVPGHDNAAVDGYAFRHGDLAPDGPTALPVADRLAAGASTAAPLPAGAAVRIFTGAALPDGADTVVMQEDVTLPEDGVVAIPAGLRPGANARSHGEDLRAGETVIATGARLRPQDIAALASIGAAEVAVYRPLRVAVLSTGDELRRPGEATAPGEVYDANAYLLLGLLKGLPVEVADLGILRDTASAVEAALRDAAGRFDVILTSGGASRGEEDHLVKAVSKLGRLHGWQIAVKPGRPMGFGAIRDAAIMTLPGNPVAAMVCFLLYAMPMIARLGGGRPPAPRRFPLPAAFALAKKKPDRREFLRGFTVERDGRLFADKFPRDGSGLISSLRAASGLIEIPEQVTRVDEGDMVAFVPFSEFGLPA